MSRSWTIRSFDDRRRLHPLPTLPVRRRAWKWLEVRRKTPARLVEGNPRARRKIPELILADLADGEIARVRVREVEARHRCGGQHREALGHRHVDSVGFEESKQRPLHRVVGTSRITGRRTNAAILLA